MKFTRELEAQRAVLLRQLRRAGPVIEGSLAIVQRTCGKGNCRCREREKHQAMILCKKVKGRSHATYVPVELQDEVRRWNQEHKRIKRVLKELSRISEQMIRGYVKDKRRAKRVRQSLTVVRSSS